MTKNMITEILILSFAISVNAADKRTSARIKKVEAYSTGILVWLQRIEGDVIPMGASGYFGQTSNTRLLLADTPAEIEARKHMLSTALAAYSMGDPVWFYWSDVDQKIASLMPVK
jgi:hypothetical protein